MGAPVARRYRLYEEGTPERAIQDAVAALHPERQETFFEEIAALVGINADSIKGTFYKVLRGDGSLPVSHRKAYIEAGISSALIDALMPSQADSQGRTRLQRLVAENEERKKQIEALTRLVDGLVRRVTRLETQASKTRQGNPA